jgi:carboxypeptidase Q
MFKQKIASAFLLSALLTMPNYALLAQTGEAPTATTTAAAAPTASAKAVYKAPDEILAKIKDEGMKNSKVMDTLSYLTDIIGPRLTNSPQMKRANEWTRDTMKNWGLQNARLEPFGPFGRGWSLKSFSAQVVEPQAIPLIAYPKAWSPGTNGVVTAEVVYLDAKTDADLEKYKGQLKGKIVLVSDMRPLEADFKGMGTRRSDEDLAKMAAAPDPANAPPRAPRQAGTPEQMQQFMQRFLLQAKRMNLLVSEGAAALIDNSSKGDGGTLFVSAASVAQEVPTDPQQLFNRRGGLSPYQKEAEGKMIPQMTLATEHYNRLVRMIKAGEKPKMTVELAVQYQDADLMGYNTIAEIPGTDLKDEVVMLGGHMDSWHAGTGATDNAAGVAVAMEAARIIQTLGLKPRRTIRVALWSGEEQGLIGSRAYVKEHFGEMQGAGQGQPGTLTKKPAYEKLSAYYNLDNGTGRIRGVYMQGNAAVRPIFETWLAPFRETGAATLTMSNTGGTDHLAFDAIGLPGFQFIQDEIEYSTRTHHSNQDLYDRIQADDMKQAATIMAAFVYQTAMMDEKMPRKTMQTAAAASNR